MRLLCIILFSVSSLSQIVKMAPSKCGYIYGEIIGGSDPREQDSIFLYDSYQLGLFVQNHNINYPPHAHDAEEVRP
jgi:hypothetical protein